VNSATQTNEYTAAWTAPEILKGAGTITQKADVFALGMVVLEVCPHALPHLVLEVEAWMVHLTSESSLSFLQEGIHLVNSQPRLLLQRLWMVVGRLVPRGHGDLV
jgi:serine/threonine protein kinase